MEMKSRIASPGKAPGKLQSPCGMAVHQAAGLVYVADTGNDRVQVLTLSGRFQKLIGGSFDKGMDEEFNVGGESPCSDMSPQMPTGK